MPSAGYCQVGHDQAQRCGWGAGCCVRQRQSLARWQPASGRVSLCGRTDLHPARYRDRRRPKSGNVEKRQTDREPEERYPQRWGNARQSPGRSRPGRARANREADRLLKCPVLPLFGACNQLPCGFVVEVFPAEALESLKLEIRCCRDCCSAISFSSDVGSMANRSLRIFNSEARTSRSNSSKLPKAFCIFSPPLPISLRKSAVPGSRWSAASPLMNASTGRPLFSLGDTPAA